jgi:cell wall-associated NlpC family hydrolase
VLSCAIAVLTTVVAVPGARADDPRYPSDSEIKHSKQTVLEKAARLGLIQARLAQASTAMRQLDMAAAQAAEAYNGAVLRLRQSEQAAADARRRAGNAQQAVAVANIRKGQLAAATYRMGGDFGGAAALLFADGPQALMDQSAMLDYLGRKREVILDQAKAASIVAGILDRQAADALAAQQAAATAVLKAKQRAEAAVTVQQAQVAMIQAQHHTLITELAAARKTTVALEEARQRGLAEEAARRAAKARSGTGYFPGGASAGTSVGAKRALAYARAQLGKPYVWAAAGPDSFDCSGLTMMAWRAGGVELPHYSVAQYEQVQHIPSSNLRAGDLLFWSSIPGDPGSIYHVGMYIGGGLMVEAPRTGDVVKVADMYIMGVPDFFGRP